jgi:hypothetical protein
MNEFTPYRNAANGLLQQTNTDQGDTANRTGIYYTLLALSDAHSDDLGRLTAQGYRRDLEKLQTADGEYCRAPDKSKWYAFPGCFGRDQHAPLILAAAANKDTRSLWNLVKRFPLRLFFHQNTYQMGPSSPRAFPDIPTPGELSCVLRGFTVSKWLLPLTILPILVCDLLSLTDNIFRKLGSRWGADNLIAARLCYELSHYPTPFTLLNKAIYKRSDYVSNITQYYSNDNGNNGLPPLGAIYVKTVSEILK